MRLHSINYFTSNAKEAFAPSKTFIIIRREKRTIRDRDNVLNLDNLTKG